MTIILLAFKIINILYHRKGSAISKIYQRGIIKIQFSPTIKKNKGIFDNEINLR